MLIVSEVAVVAVSDGGTAVLLDDSGTDDSGRCLFRDGAMAV